MHPGGPTVLNKQSAGLSRVVSASCISRRCITLLILSPFAATTCTCLHPDKLAPQEYERELAVVRRDLSAREAELDVTRRMADDIKFKVETFLTPTPSSPCLYPPRCPHPNSPSIFPAPPPNANSDLHPHHPKLNLRPLSIPIFNPPSSPCNAGKVQEETKRGRACIS